MFTVLLQAKGEDRLLIEYSTSHPRYNVICRRQGRCSRRRICRPARRIRGECREGAALFKGFTSRAEINLTGQSYGKAMALKVIGNMIEQLAEGYVLAEKSCQAPRPCRSSSRSCCQECITRTACACLQVTATSARSYCSRSTLRRRMPGMPRRWRRQRGMRISPVSRSIKARYAILLAFMVQEGRKLDSSLKIKLKEEIISLLVAGQMHVRRWAICFVQKAPAACACKPLLG